MAQQTARPPLVFYFTRPILRGILKLLFKTTIEGREHLPKTPYILISNHLGWIDPLFYLAYWPISPQVLFVGNAATTTDNWMTKVLVGLAGNPLVPFSKRDRRSRMKALQEMLRKAKAGKIVGFFPEGRVGEEGKMCPFHLGAFVVAHKLGRPILPVGWAGGKTLYWRKRIHLRIGEPLIPREGETLEMLATRAHETLRELIPPYPGDLPKRRLKWLATMFHIEDHPFVFDGIQAIYDDTDPDGYGIPTNEKHD